MEYNLRIWRQKDRCSSGHLVNYRACDVTPEMSFFEMLNSVNRTIEEKGDEPIAYECDCLEGICGTCSLVINGVPHGPDTGITTCQLHMRSFADGENITIEPFRAAAFPVIKDLVVDRSSLDRIIQAGGFVSVNTGGTPDGNTIPIAQDKAETAMDAAACIGCGACVAACKNSSAMLFTAAKIGHLANLPQGLPERYRRVLKMIQAMDAEGFGACTNQEECSAVCPKEISTRFIAQLNREYLKASLLKG